MKSLLTLGLCDFSFSFPPSFYVGFSRSNREIVPTFHEGLLRASRSGKNLYRLPLHFMALFLLRRFRSIRPRFLGTGLFQRGVDGGVVGFQHFLFPFQTHIDVPVVTASKFMERPSDAPIPARVWPSTSPTV